MELAFIVDISANRCFTIWISFIFVLNFLPSFLVLNFEVVWSRDFFFWRIIVKFLHWLLFLCNHPLNLLLDSHFLVQLVFWNFILNCLLVFYLLFHLFNHLLIHQHTDTLGRFAKAFESSKLSLFQNTLLSGFQLLQLSLLTCFFRIKNRVDWQKSRILLGVSSKAWVLDRRGCVVVCCKRLTFCIWHFDL